MDKGRRHTGECFRVLLKRSQSTADIMYILVPGKRNAKRILCIRPPDLADNVKDCLAAPQCHSRAINRGASQLRGGGDQTSDIVKKYDEIAKSTSYFRECSSPGMYSPYVYLFIFLTLMIQKT